MMPAMRATASASPLGSAPSRSRRTTSADTSTRPLAVAVRTVTSLPATSTMRAAPLSSTCVNLLIAAPASCLASLEQHDAHRLTRRHLGGRLGDDDQGVGAGE